MKALQKKLRFEKYWADKLKVAYKRDHPNRECVEVYECVQGYGVALVFIEDGIKQCDYMPWTRSI